MRYSVVAGNNAQTRLNKNRQPMHKHSLTHDPENGLSTSVIVSPPSPPTSAKRRRRLSAMLAGMDAVKEAHLVEVVTLGEPGSKRLVLFVVVYERMEIDTVRSSVARRLKKIRRFRERLDLHVACEDFPLMETIREAKCIVGWRD